MEQDRLVESSLDLIARAREGDQDAVRRLFERYVPPLRRWATGRLPSGAREMLDTDDIVQDALVAVLRRLDGFEPRGAGALHAYLRQALRRRIIDEARRVRGRPPAVPIDEEHPDPDASPLERTIGAETLERYERALAALPEAERDLVVARVEMNLGYAEIAATAGKPSADAARMAVSRALLRLAREMDR